MNSMVPKDQRGWSGSAMVLGKLLVPGPPTNLDKSRARAYCAYSRCGGGGVVWTVLLSSIISLFFLPHSGRRLHSPRRLFCFGSFVILDVARFYLWLFLLLINIRIGKIVVKY